MSKEAHRQGQEEELPVQTDCFHKIKEGNKNERDSKCLFVF